jgi:hypothetical protein
MNVFLEYVDEDLGAISPSPPLQSLNGLQTPVLCHKVSATKIVFRRLLIRIIINVIYPAMTTALLW